jgi:hypothetical protein
MERIALNEISLSATTECLKNSSRQSQYDGYESTVMTYFDVAVDSDNNGFIERSDLENSLEDNEYGLGKIIDVKENQYITTNTQLIPIQITIPNFIKYDRSEYGLTFSPANHIIYYKKTGRNQYTRIDDIRYSYESFGMPIDDEYLWDASGNITIYASMSYSVTSRSPSVDHDNRTYHDADVSGKPTQYLEITLVKMHETIHFIDHIIASDVIRYISIDPDKGSFYKELQSNVDLRYAIAASQIYGRNDAPEFCLQLLDKEELRGLGIEHPDILNYLTTDYGSSSNGDGFNAGIYKDFISQKYILAFQGTDFYSLPDWVTNISGGIKVGTTQHIKTFNIATYISRDNNKNMINEQNKPSSEYLKENIMIVGHSLGGGLASVASIASGISAMTFNSAGLNQPLFTNIFNAVKGSWEISDPRRTIIQNRINNWSSSILNIKRVANEWDILTKAQHYVNMIPEAVGNPYKVLLDSQYDTKIEEKGILNNSIGISFVNTLIDSNNQFYSNFSSLWSSLITGINIRPFL